MYVFFQHHISDAKTISLTEIKLSSDNTRWKIDFYNPTEKARFELSKKALKEITPVAFRSYDEATKIWSYFAPYGEKVLDAIRVATSIVGTVTFVEVEDLASLATQSFFDLNKRRKTVKPEDFFYNAAPQGAPPMSKEQAAAKLLTLFEVSSMPTEKADIKKLYRRAALRLHPDRNQGNGSAMSELNMLWGVYNGA